METPTVADVERSRLSLLVQVSAILCECSDDDALKALRVLGEHLGGKTLGSLVAALFISMQTYLSNESIDKLVTFCNELNTNNNNNKSPNCKVPLQSPIQSPLESPICIQSPSISLLLCLSDDVLTRLAKYLSKNDSISIGSCNRQLYYSTQRREYLQNSNFNHELYIRRQEIKLIFNLKFDLYHWCVGCKSVQFMESDSIDELGLNKENNTIDGIDFKWKEVDEETKAKAKIQVKTPTPEVQKPQLQLQSEEEEEFRETREARAAKLNWFKILMKSTRKLKFRLTDGPNDGQIALISYLPINLIMGKYCKNKNKCDWERERSSQREREKLDLYFCDLNNNEAKTFFDKIESYFVTHCNKEISNMREIGTITCVDTPCVYEKHLNREMFKSNFEGFASADWKFCHVVGECTFSLDSYENIQTIFHDNLKYVDVRCIKMKNQVLIDILEKIEAKIATVAIARNNDSSNNNNNNNNDNICDHQIARLNIYDSIHSNSVCDDISNQIAFMNQKMGHPNMNVKSLSADQVVSVMKEYKDDTDFSSYDTFVRLVWNSKWALRLYKEFICQANGSCIKRLKVMDSTARCTNYDDGEDGINSNQHGLKSLTQILVSPLKCHLLKLSDYSTNNSNNSNNSINVNKCYCSNSVESIEFLFDVFNDDTSNTSYLIDKFDTTMKCIYDNFFFLNNLTICLYFSYETDALDDETEQLSVDEKSQIKTDIMDTVDEWSLELIKINEKYLDTFISSRSNHCQKDFTIQLKFKVGHFHSKTAADIKIDVDEQRDKQDKQDKGFTAQINHDIGIMGRVAVDTVLANKVDILRRRFVVACAQTLKKQ